MFPWVRLGHSDVVVGNLAATRAYLYLPFLGASQCACTPHKLIPGFSSLSISSFPTIQGGLSPLCMTPGLGWPLGGSTCSLPRAGVHSCNFPFPLSPLPGKDVMTWSLFFPFYPITCVFFLQPCLYRCPSASFWLVFSENCSTGRCNFHVFIGRDELHILLFGHLHLQPLNHCLLKSYNGWGILLCTFFIYYVGKTSQERLSDLSKGSTWMEI